MEKRKSLIDEEISLKSLSIDKNGPENDINKLYLISLLASMSYCYLELRNYSESEKCLIEALRISEDKCPMIYFRLGQVMMYNRFSKEESWATALSYFTKAKRLLLLNRCEDNLYEWTDKKLISLIEKEISKLNERIRHHEDLYINNKRSKFE